MNREKDNTAFKTVAAILFTGIVTVTLSFFASTSDSDKEEAKGENYYSIAQAYPHDLIESIINHQ